MLQVRLVGHSGYPDRATNEKSTPPLWYKPKKGGVGRAILAEYCFNDKQQFLKWQQNISLQDLAYVLYDQCNCPKEVWLYGRKIRKREAAQELMSYLVNHCLFTMYDRTRNYPRSVTVFYVNDYQKGYIRAKWEI